jgi:hypothetical protein
MVQDGARQQILRRARANFTYTCFTKSERDNLMSKNHGNNNGGNNNQNQRQGDSNAGYWIGFFAKIVLGVAMLLYLGMHSYNFFTFTFKGNQWIFAILGLFTTSIGFLLWLSIYLYIAKDGLQKAIAIIMIFVSLGGEFAVAAFDMYMNISGQLSTQQWAVEDLRNMSYIIAGLALLNGLALVIDIAGKQIFDDLRNVKSNRNEQPQQQPQQSNDSSNVNPKPNYYPPHGERQHPDVVFAKLPSEQLQKIRQAWESHDNQRLNVTPEKDVTLIQPAPATGGGAKETPFPKNGQNP